MEEQELKSIISNEIANSLGMTGSSLSDQRTRLLEYYEGILPRGNGIPDRSQLTDRTVMEVIHWLLPDLIRVFMSTDKVISFEPRRPQDTQLAMTITEYINFILREDNEGFKLIYEWIKTSLIQKNGFLKVSFEPQTQITMNSFTGLTDQELAMLMEEIKEAEKYEIVEQTDYPDHSAQLAPPPPPPSMAQPAMPPGAMPPGPPGGPPAPAGLPVKPAAPPGAPPGPPPGPMGPHGPPPPGAPPMQPPMGGISGGAAPGAMPPAQPAAPPMGPPPGAPPMPPPMLHDIRCRIYESEGRVVIRHVLPEDVLISPRCPSTKFDGTHFVGHRAILTVSDLRLMGYDDDLIDEARGEDTQDWNEERIVRFGRDDDDSTSMRTDEAMVPVILTECYLKVDFDDDGIAELRKVVTARDGAIILENVEVDEVPLINLTPIIEPGKAIGTSVAELVTDCQESMSAMNRGVMDSLYLSLIPRNVVNVNKLTEDTFEDLNEGSPGVSIRVNDDGAVIPLETAFVGQQALPVMEYLAQKVQTRTGVGPQNNIVSPDLLNNQTAAGISMQQNAASGQIELICRVMAETGFRELARHILGLVVRHQDRARMIRLNGQFVQMDPRYWHENFDISVTVGLGTGNKEKTTRDLMGILQIMQPILMQQKGMQGPFITSADVHQVTSKLTEAMGYKEDFFPHLLQPAQGGQDQQQDPEVMKAQAQAQIETQKGQMQMQIMQQKAQLESQLAQQKHEAEMQRDMEKAQNQMAIERMREEAKAALQQQQLTAQLAMDVTE